MPLLRMMQNAIADWFVFGDFAAKLILGAWQTQMADFKVIPNKRLKADIWHHFRHKRN